MTNRLEIDPIISELWRHTSYESLASWPLLSSTALKADIKLDTDAWVLFRANSMQHFTQSVDSSSQVRFEAIKLLHICGDIDEKASAT